MSDDAAGGSDEDIKIPLPSTDSGSAQDTLTQNTENVEVVPDLFIVEGNPMKFYVAPCKDRPQIVKLIEAGGGIVNKTYTADAYTLVDGNSDISSKILGDCYSVDYIADAVLEDKLPPDLQKYHIKTKRKKSARKDSLTSPRKRHKFTEEDDAKLAKFVRKHGDLSSSSSVLWKLAEQEGITEGHTWQSMRSRFLKVVQPRLEENPSKLPGSGDGLDDIDNDLADPSLHDDIDGLAQNPAKKQKTEHTESEEAYLQPQMSYPSDPKETVTAIINYLAAATNLSKSIVVHALIVNSGVVRDALEYLRNPQEFCRSKNKSNQIWTHAEDKILLEKDKRGMMILEQERGPSAIRERLTFLES